MTSYVFELYVRSLDCSTKSFNSYIRLNNDEAVVKDGELMGITEKGWCKIGAIKKHERIYFELKLLTIQDRINLMSELDYEIQKLMTNRRALELNTDEALYQEEVWAKSFIDTNVYDFAKSNVVAHE